VNSVGMVAISPQTQIKVKFEPPAPVVLPHNRQKILWRISRGESVLTFPLGIAMERWSEIRYVAELPDALGSVRAVAWQQHALAAKPI